MLMVEVVYAAETGVLKRSCELPMGSTVADALKASGFYEMYPESKLCAIGVFSKQASLDTILRAGDRVELYRSLKRDPKARRRAQSKSSKK